MAAKRRSTDAGHRRKFLVIIDDTPECGRAVHFAARRGRHTDPGNLDDETVVAIA